MTLYRDFETNREVTDVLFCIVSGYNTVKHMMKALKQPQSTISTKLQFLLKNKVIAKSKWEFHPDWNRLYQVMYNVLKHNSPIALQLYVKSHIRKEFGINDSRMVQLQKVVKNIEAYFPKGRLKRMLEAYSRLSLDTREKASIQDIINQYFVGLIESRDASDKKLSELKEIMIKVPSKELAFFKSVENNIKW